MTIVRVVRRLTRGLLRGMLHRWPTTLLALGLLVGGSTTLWSRGLVPGLPAFPGAPGLEAAGRGSSDVREMTVETLRQVRNGEQIDLVLKEKSGNRRLEITAGQPEALAIASDLRNQKTDFVVTYDVMRSLVHGLGATVDRVVVNNVTDTTFYAKVIMSSDNRQVEIDARPSDAIALALRAKAPIYAEASVLDKAGVQSSR
jgi:uncharacterized protein